MNRLKRVIGHHFPASRLPDALRGDIDPARRVQVTVEELGPDDVEYEVVVQDFSSLPQDLSIAHVASTPLGDTRVDQ